MRRCIYVNRRCMYEGNDVPCGKCLADELAAARNKVQALMDGNAKLCNELSATRDELTRIVNDRDNKEPAEREGSRPRILFECDNRACASCRAYCTYTTDITHAKNFELVGEVFTEKIK